MKKSKKNIEFSHIHRDLIKSLKLEITDYEFKDGTQEEIWNQNLKLIDEIIIDLEQDKLEPEYILQKGLKSLGRVEAQRFVVENMLETIKRGHEADLVNTYQGFRKIGLIDGGSPSPELSKIQVVQQPSGDSQNTQTEPKEGKFLKVIWNKLKRVKVILFRVVVNSLKVIPKLIGIKPRIGIAGPFPTIDFEINLQTESITIHDFLETLGENVWSKA